MSLLEMRMTACHLNWCTICRCQYLVLKIRFTKSRFDSSLSSNEEFYVHTLFGVPSCLQQVRLTPIHKLRVCMGVTRNFSRGVGLPFAWTSFIGLKPIHIKGSSDSRGAWAPPSPPPCDTHARMWDSGICFGYKRLTFQSWYLYLSLHT